MCASGKTAECCGFEFKVVICNGFMSGCFLSFEIRRPTRVHWFAAPFWVLDFRQPTIYVFFIYRYICIFVSCTAPPFRKCHQIDLTFRRLPLSEFLAFGRSFSRVLSPVVAWGWWWAVGLGYTRTADSLCGLRVSFKEQLSVCMTRRTSKALAFWSRWL